MVSQQQKKNKFQIKKLSPLVAIYILSYIVFEVILNIFIIKNPS